MNSRAPNAYFAEGLLIFGALEKGGVAAKGFFLQPPDLRGASVTALNGYQDKVRALLANLGEGMRAQFQWTCDSDYRQELTRYFRETEKVVHPHLKAVQSRHVRTLPDDVVSRPGPRVVEALLAVEAAIR